MYYLLKNAFIPYTFSDKQFFSRVFNKESLFTTTDGETVPNVSTLKTATAVKTYNVRCNVGVPLYCSELTKVLAVTKDNKFEKKYVRDLTNEDSILQPYGYFKKYFDSTVFETNCLQESFHYIYGLWYGRGERFYSNQPCIRFDSKKDYDICEILNKSSYVASQETSGDLITYYLQKRIVLNSEEFVSNFISFKNAYLFTRGLVDGCGFVYYGEGHNSDLGLKFQDKSKDIAELVQVVLQSLGVMSYCSDSYVSPLFNAQLKNFDLRIRGKESVRNFHEYFGFTNTFKNDLLKGLKNSFEGESFVPKCVGSYLYDKYPEIRNDFANLDPTVQTFLLGEDGLPYSMLEVFSTLDDELVNCMLHGGILSLVKTLEVHTGYFRGKGLSIPENSSMIVGSFYIC